MFNKLFRTKPELDKSDSKPKRKEAEVIRMPKMSDTMKHATISKWHFQEGDHLKCGAIIAEVETDKATMELENYVEGTILYLSVKEGEQVPVDGIVAIIGNKGENISHLIENKETKLGREFEKREKTVVTGYLGEVKMFAGDFIPENWLKCDGAKFNKQDKPELFSIIGFKYGGEGELFQIPNIDSLSGVIYIICVQNET